MRAHQRQAGLKTLAVTVTITDQAKPKDRLAINVANWDSPQFATDWVEFDIAFSPAAMKRHEKFTTSERHVVQKFLTTS